jgi:putative membrane protein insertion efficiency factor
MSFSPAESPAESPVSSAASTTFVQRRALRWIEAYQRAFAGRPSPCRFYPTCSCYAHEAFEVHGTARGAWLTLTRLLRCRPFGPSGFDPVPEPRLPDPRKPAARPVREDD